MTSFGSKEWARIHRPKDYYRYFNPAEGKGMRRVRVYRVDKTLVGEGTFHQWGCNYNEFDSGPGNFTTAIVEMEDGTVKNIDCELIEFIKPRKGVV
jgi:hypothetical protein